MVLYIGMFLLMLAFLVSTAFQAVFVNPVFLWLGKHSFPIYLLHGPLLRSFYNWLLFAFVYPYYQVDKNSAGVVIKQTLAPMPHPPKWKFVVTLPIFFAVLLYLSKCWMDRVDPWCAKLARGIEDIVTGKRSLFLSFVETSEPCLPTVQTDDERGRLLLR
jgi:hypothetical protein